MWPIPVLSTQPTCTLTYEIQYALPAGGLRRRAINDLRSAHNAAAGSSTTHLAVSGNRQYERFAHDLGSHHGPMPQRVRMFLDGLVRLAALLSRVGDVADRPYCRLWAGSS